MPLRTVPVLTTTFSDDIATCDARELLDRARIVFGVASLYALGGILGLDPQYPIRWYRFNSMPSTARALLRVRVTQGEGER